MAKGGKQPGAGRPRGSTTKPRLSDHLSDKEINAIVSKAKELALLGSEAMIKLLIEQKFGKAVQPLEGEMNGNITVTFDNAFNDSSPQPEVNS